MLSTAEGQSNTVFACFGSAAQHAQMLEQAFVRFLHLYNQFSGRSLTLEKLNKQTLGSLIKELEKHVTLNDPRPPELLSAALESRNFLMHHFFLERDLQLADEPGRFALLSELLAIEGLLNNGRVLVNAMRIAVCRTLDVEDPYAAE